MNQPTNQKSHARRPPELDYDRQPGEKTASEQDNSPHITNNSTGMITFPAKSYPNDVA